MKEKEYLQGWNLILANISKSMSLHMASQAKNTCIFLENLESHEELRKEKEDLKLEKGNSSN